METVYFLHDPLTGTKTRWESQNVDRKHVWALLHSFDGNLLGAHNIPKPNIDTHFWHYLVVAKTNTHAQTQTMQFQAYHRGSNFHSSMYLPGINGDGRIPTQSVLKPVKKPWKVHDLKKDVVHKPAVVKPQIAKPSVENVAEPKVQVQKTRTVKKKEEPTEIFYRVWPSGAFKSFIRPKHNAKTTTAATAIQSAARGLIARTNFRITLLEHKLASAEKRTLQAVEAIQEETQKKKLKIRRKTTKMEAKTIKKQMACNQTAVEGAKLIHYLREENKKLRAKNDKIARAILELKQQNDRLEHAQQATGENKTLLSEHYEKIKETNAALLAVEPKYAAKVQELKEASELRRQYCLTEHKMKINYVKLVGTITEMVEDHCQDKDLIKEIVGYALEIESEQPVESSEHPLEDDEEEDEDDEYNEEDSDSNDYDEFTLHSMD